VLRRLDGLRDARGYHLVGIDGKVACGKSPLGRYLAYHLRRHLVPLDLFMLPNTFPPPLANMRMHLPKLRARLPDTDRLDSASSQVIRGR